MTDYNADYRHMAVNVAAKLYSDDALSEDHDLALEIAKIVDELHVGHIHLFAVDVDEDVFLVRFEDDTSTLTIEWRSAR